jgi:hypothetical protein
MRPLTQKPVDLMRRPILNRTNGRAGLRAIPRELDDARGRGDDGPGQLRPGARPKVRGRGGAALEPLSGKQAVLDDRRTFEAVAEGRRKAAICGTTRGKKRSQAQKARSGVSRIE